MKGNQIQREIIRDMGDMERLWIEWVDDGQFITVYKEELGDRDPVLTLESNEIEKFVEVLEEAEGDLQMSDGDAYV